jgi:hypothetical protein
MIISRAEYDRLNRELVQAQTRLDGALAEIDRLRRAPYPPRENRWTGTGAVEGAVVFEDASPPTTIVRTVPGMPNQMTPEMPANIVQAINAVVRRVPQTERGRLRSQLWAFARGRFEAEGPEYAEDIAREITVGGINEGFEDLLDGREAGG